MSAAVVSVVDDDPAIRDSLSLLLETAGFKVRCYADAESFLAAYREDQPGCLVLDVRMSPISGPELHAELVRRGSRLPVIFLTAHGDIPMTVRAMKAGAVDFLTKPVDGAKLLERVQGALQQHLAARDRESTQAGLRQRLGSLTGREREVMFLVVAGQSCKAIAKRLDISYRTVELHRSRVLHKTGTATVLELAQLVADAGIAAGGEQLPAAGSAPAES
jgi:FixJ family two-component response regulator